MSLPDSYLAYAHRRPGIDTSLFEDRRLDQVGPFSWPNGARVGVMPVVQLQHFPLDMGKAPFVPPGGLERTYPDYWHYTMRDYGNRVGIYRLMAVFDELGICPTVAVNADIAERYPVLLADIDERGWEIVASGKSMGHLHHAGLSEAAERQLITESLERLQRASSRPIRGWSSPAGHSSPNTMPLLAEAGIEYVTDFVNDELPFPVTTRSGSLFAVPVGTELSDIRLVAQQHHSSEDYVAEIRAAHDYLKAEKSGRLLSLSLTPWIMGQAHRTPALRRMLEHLSADDATRFMTAGSVLDAWRDAMASKNPVG